MDNKRFIIIGRSTCPFCNMAQDYLSALGQELIFLDYATKPTILEDYKEFHGQSTVPIILSNDLQSGHTHKVAGYIDSLEFFGD